MGEFHNYQNSDEDFPVEEGHESLEQRMLVEVPLNEKLRDASWTKEMWPEYGDALGEQVSERARLSDAVMHGLERSIALGKTPDEAIYTNELYETDVNEMMNGLAELLSEPENRRLALYLPFELFGKSLNKNTERATNDFRDSYRTAWERLLYVHDVRANFDDGDVYELDARPGDPERVVKAAHLTPWLVKSNLVSIDEVLQIMDETDDIVLKNSFLDAVPVLKDFDLLSQEAEAQFNNLREHTPRPEDKQEPLYVSEGREKWLKTQAKAPARPTGLVEAELVEHGKNLPALSAEIENVIATFDDNPELFDRVLPIALIGGSRLKGYGRPESDTDINLLAFFNLSTEDMTNISNVFGENGANTLKLNIQDGEVSIDKTTGEEPDLASIFFDSAWIGDPEALRELQKRIMPIYFEEKDERTRMASVERLEQDLLQYRLLHKGHATKFPDDNPEIKKFDSIDGRSAFYESSYRRIATELFARSVFIPEA